MSRIYLVDGTNLARGADYDPRFPAMEQARTEELVALVARLAERMGERAEVEIFFDGPRRAVGEPGRARLRFSAEASADDMIQGKVRLIRSKGRGVVVATEDGDLGRDVRSEGAQVIGKEELWHLCGG